MEIETLRYFVALHDSPSLSKAAQRCFISKQGLGKAMTALEEELGVSLLERSHAGIAFTEQGKHFFGVASRIIDTFDQGVLSFPSPKAKTASQHCIVSTPYIMQATAIAQNATGVLSSTRLEELPFTSIIKRLENTDETGIFGCEIFPESMREVQERDLIFKPFSHASVGVLWNPDAFNFHPEVSAEALSDVPLSTSSIRSMTKLYENAFARFPLENIRLRTSNLLAIFDGALSGVMCGIIDTYMLDILLYAKPDEMRKLRFSLLDAPDTSFSIGFLYRRDAKISPRDTRYMNESNAFHYGLMQQRKKFLSL